MAQDRRMKIIFLADQNPLCLPSGPKNLFLSHFPSDMFSFLTRSRRRSSEDEEENIFINFLPPDGPIPFIPVLN